MKLMARKKPEMTHDRRAKDTLAAGQYGSIDVADPYGDAGEKITVLRQFRNDPLARLHSHHQIDDAQYHAGRCYQRDWETAERGARAIDPTREAVDGGRMPEAITEGQRRSVIRLNAANAELGSIGSSVVFDILIGGMSLQSVVEKHGKSGQYQLRIYGQKLREGLDVLASFYGFSSSRPAKTF